jgi:transcriptional regulator GlxA family with amidase domain
VNSDSARRKRISGAVLAALNDFTATAFVNPDPMRSARFAEERFDGLLGAFVSALSPEPSPPSVTASQSHRQLVRLAQQCIDAHLADTLRIKDLCATSDVSYKTLERAFLAVLGVTPRRYLSLSRLARARRLLLEANQETTRVADVALACGYDELGRFSIDYRQWFGEKPSHTLSRSA